MAKNVELLLTESVEALGIVGDVVKVRTGYARNFLLPRNLATLPSEEKIKELAAKRADAERHLAELRQHREELVQKMNGVQVDMIRSCNDQGVLYGAVTQQEIATALGAMGFGVRPRDVRLAQTIKRVDTYEVHIKFEADLEAIIKLWVMPDRKLDLHKDDHAAEAAAAPAAPAEEAKPAAPAKTDSWSKQVKHEKHDKHDKAHKGDKHDKAEKADKAAHKGEDKPAKKSKKKSDE